MLRIGYQRYEYPEIRNILSCNSYGVNFVKIPESKFDQKWIGSAKESNYFREFAVSVPDDFKCDCLHFFNSLPLNARPFVTTFETSLPRWWGVDKDIWNEGIEILNSPFCRRLFAISDNALDIFKWSIKDLPFNLQANVLSKTEVLPPPQQVYPVDFTRFINDDELKIIFVGGDFLRKGGLELLRAFEEATKLGSKLHLTIVSKINVQGMMAHPWNHNYEEKLVESKSIINSNSKIKHFYYLENDEIIKELSQSHVAVLPSYGDTFGYFVLESQANGLPVITTNIRAFPSINNSDIGWVLEIPIVSNGKPDLNSKNFDFVSKNLQSNLLQVLLSISTIDRHILKKMGEMAYKQVATVHNPDKIGKHLLKFYTAT